jgi:uncharacterized protein (DUF305 family)
MNESGTTMGEMDMTSQLAGLEGEAFEVGFMSMMITHHQSATEMAQWILERTENPRSPRRPRSSSRSRKLRSHR